MSMLKQLLEDIARSPDDWSLRGVLADWCEDNQQPQRAECLRWMIRQKKRPHKASGGQASWFNADKVQPDLGEPESDLPDALFRRLEGGWQAANHRTYGDFLQAEE